MIGVPPDASVVDPFGLHPVLQSPFKSGSAVFLQLDLALSMSASRAPTVLDDGAVPSWRGLSLPRRELPLAPTRQAIVLQPETLDQMTGIRQAATHPPSHPTAESLASQRAAHPSVPPPQARSGVPSIESLASVGGASSFAAPSSERGPRSLTNAPKWNLTHTTKSSACPRRVPFRWAVASLAEVNGAPPEHPQLQAGDLFVHKITSEQASAKYRAWVYWPADRPARPASASEEQPQTLAWLEVPLDSMQPHPNSDLPLVFTFHRDSEKPSWVLPRSVKRYGQAKVKREAEDDLLAAFRLPPQKKQKTRADRT